MNNVRQVKYPLLIGKEINNEELKERYNIKDETKKSPVKLVKREAKDLDFSEDQKFTRLFDHFKIIDGISIYRITEISVFSSSYIWGLEVKYRIEGKPTVTVHLGTAEPEFIETLTLKEGEDIDYVACSFSQKGRKIALESDFTNSIKSTFCHI